MLSPLHQLCTSLFEVFSALGIIPEFDGCVCVCLCLWEDTPKRDVMYVPNLIGVQPADT